MIRSDNEVKKCEECNDILYFVLRMLTTTGIYLDTKQLPLSGIRRSLRTFSHLLFALTTLTNGSNVRDIGLPTKGCHVINGFIICCKTQKWIAHPVWFIRIFPIRCNNIYSIESFRLPSSKSIVISYNMQNIFDIIN